MYIIIYIFISSVLGQSTSYMFLTSNHPTIAEATYARGQWLYEPRSPGLGHEAKGGSQWIQCPYAHGARDRHGTPSNGDAYHLADRSSEFLKNCVSSFCGELVLIIKVENVHVHIFDCGKKICQ